MFFSGASDTAPDKQRRFIMPQYLKGYASIKRETILISQIVSGYPEDCQLISAIMNHPLLERASSSDQLHVTSESEYDAMLCKAHFSNIDILLVNTN